MNSEEEYDNLPPLIDQEFIDSLTEEEKGRLAMIQEYGFDEAQKEMGKLRQTTEEEKLELIKIQKQELTRIKQEEEKRKEAIRTVNKCKSNAMIILKEVLSPLIGNTKPCTDADDILYETLFITKVYNAIGSDKTVCLELAEFIRSSKPKDILECYHFLNMFLLNQVALKAMTFVSKDCSHEVIQEYMKIIAKSTSTFGKGMVAVRNYRNGVNIIKNQNNTLNQVNINKNNEE